VDTLTHGLFGVAMYAAVKTPDLSKRERLVLLGSLVFANQAPDLDVLAGVTETGRTMMQSWHRGLTHSIALAPLIAWLTWLVARLGYKRKGLYPLLLAGVVLHYTIDFFNTWGTGYHEPFPDIGVPFGTVPIVDPVIWLMFAVAFFAGRKIGQRKAIRGAFVGLLVWVAFRSMLGAFYLMDEAERYDEVTLAAGFAPGVYDVIGRDGDDVEVVRRSVFAKRDVTRRFVSDPSVKDDLFARNKKAEVLAGWSPFVVYGRTDDGPFVFDPRIWRGDEPLLIERALD